MAKSFFTSLMKVLGIIAGLLFSLVVFIGKSLNQAMLAVLRRM